MVAVASPAYDDPYVQNSGISGNPTLGRPNPHDPSERASALRGSPNPHDPSEVMRQLTPDQRAKIAALPSAEQAQALAMLAADFGQRGAAAENDMARADAIRTQAAPQGRQLSGNTYVAANPLEHLASGMQRYRANEDYKKSRTARDTAMSDADAVRKRAMEQLVSRSDALRNY